MTEYQEYLSRALATQAAEPCQEMKLLDALGQTTLYDRLPENDHTFRAVAAASGNDAYAMSADAVLGIGLRYLGDCGKARQHLDRVVRRPIEGQSVVVGYRFVAEGELSNVLWLQGLADQAIRNLEVASDHVRMTGSLYLECLTLANVTCPLALFMGDLATAESSIQLLPELPARKGLTHWGFQARCLRGALLVVRGDAAGLTLLRTGLGQLKDARFGFYTLTALYFLAEGHRSFGEIAEARATIEEALEQSDRSGEHWFMPELLRLKGEILRSCPSGTVSPEHCFLQSLDWARGQGALSWELRTATSLARLWREDGRIDAAIDLLSAVYGRFTEGFATRDLEVARALLDELRA